MRREKSGLTIIEILVVVGIIAILVGILVPALTMVQKTAKGVKQRAQFTAIDLGLAAFRNDYGEYPPSNWWDSLIPNTPQDYCGAQKLAEALLGWDLLGFHPDSAWRADGLDAVNGPETYDPAGVYKKDPVVYQQNLKKRRDRYIEMDVANAFQLGESTAGRDGLFVSTAGLWGGQPLRKNTYVLCDVYDVPERKLMLPDGRSVVPGTPILYYRANAASKTIDRTISGIRLRDLIYNSGDNVPLINLGRLSDAAKPIAQRQQHPLDMAATPPWGVNFYDYIRDSKVTAHPWPYRPDSYILISAGPDGLYGTNDDIRNFGKR